jgi:hypothetical protein
VLITLFVVAAIYGVRGAAHWQAVAAAPRLFGPTLPARCDPQPGRDAPLDSWPKPVPSPPPSGRRCLVEIAALPSFTSPFDWRIVAQMSNAYEIHDVNVLDGRLQEPAAVTEGFWRQVRRYPNIWTPAVQQAARTDLGRMFLGFSRFPAARTVVDAQGGTVVRFTDVRFVGGAFGNDRPLRRIQLFTATIRFDPQGRLVSSHLGQ